MIWRLLCWSQNVFFSFPVVAGHAVERRPMRRARSHRARSCRRPSWPWRCRFPRAIAGKPPLARLELPIVVLPDARGVEDAVEQGQWCSFGHHAIRRATNRPHLRRGPSDDSVVRS